MSFNTQSKTWSADRSRPVSQGMTRYLILLYTLIVVTAQSEQTDLTLTFRNDRELKFTEDAFNKFYECLCFNKETTCTFTYFLVIERTSPYYYRACKVDNFEKVEKSPDTPLHYYCKKPSFAVGKDGENIACTLESQDKCTDYTCSSTYHWTPANILPECPCISIQWLGFESVTYAGTNAPQDGPCQDEFQYSNGTISTNCTSISQQSPPDPFINSTNNTSGSQLSHASPIIDDNQMCSNEIGGKINIVAVGAGVGSALVILIIASVTLFHVFWQKRKHSQHGDKPPREQPDSYYNIRVISNGNNMTVGIGLEDNSGYLEYANLDRAYSEIGEDGDLTARSVGELNRPTRDNSSNHGIVNGGNDANRLDYYSNSRSRRHRVSNGLITSNREAGRVESRRKKEEHATMTTNKVFSLEKEGKFNKGIGFPYSVARPVNPGPTMAKGGNLSTIANSNRLNTSANSAEGQIYSTADYEDVEESNYLVFGGGELVAQKSDPEDTEYVELVDEHDDVEESARSV